MCGQLRGSELKIKGHATSLTTKNSVLQVTSNGCSIT